MANRHPGNEFLHTAEVISVVVGRHQVVDLFQPGVLDRRRDALGIANSAGAAVAGVDEHVLP